MSKNILIAGVARAGKSSIAENLSKNTIYNHFPVDYIASSFYINFPECKINNRVVIDNGSINLSKFLSTVIAKMEKTQEKFIIDSAHIFPKDILPYLDREKWHIYFMGYPKIEAIEKLKNIRKYDPINSWTRNFNDERLLEIIQGIIATSEEIEKQCKQYNIEFIDTSANFKQTIENYTKKIKEKI